MQIWLLLHSAIYDRNTQWDPRDDWSWIMFNLFKNGLAALFLLLLLVLLLFFHSMCLYELVTFSTCFNRLHSNFQHSRHVVPSCHPVRVLSSETDCSGEIVESLAVLEIFKIPSALSWAISSKWPCLSRWRTRWLPGAHSLLRSAQELTTKVLNRLVFSKS